jgi:hypothetical protein
LQKSRPETVERLLHQNITHPATALIGCGGVFLLKGNATMPMRSNRNDSSWKPQRLDSNESPKGRDISLAIDRASKDRSATSLKSGKRGKKC